MFKAVIQEAAALASLVPVSYTHLDVYKRQHQSRAFIVAHLAFAEQHDQRPPVAIAHGMEFRVCLLYTSRCV